MSEKDLNKLNTGEIQENENQEMEQQEIETPETAVSSDTTESATHDFLERIDEDAPKYVDEATRRKANTYFMSKVAVNFILILIGALIIGLFLRSMQAKTAVVKQEENSRLALEEAVATLEENAANVDTLTRLYHDGNQDILDDMSQLFASGLFDSLVEATNEERSEVFGDLVARSGIEYLFIMSMDGKIAISGDPSLFGVNPAARALMTQENVNDILKGSLNDDGSVTPIEVGSQYGSYYFYSMPIKYKDVEYRLVLGANANVLDIQISSLKDVSVVLSRAAVGHGGFMFAVDRDDGTFLYYNNGKDILTGQSAHSLGLSEEAMADGYTGIETIKGIKYYCVSKTFGDKTVVCAVAEQSKIVANDRYVLFWSILGFILVLLVCLIYAVIIRNDFVRHAVATDRYILNPDSENPIYFDKTVFKKVFPLMLAGVIVMFGISFYTQTLLEITEGVEKANIALDEVGGRYEESQESRSVIESYYNNRFLSKAKLISFLIEENPAVLNAKSDKYHSYYDANGEKVFLKDDEGNDLKSVSASPRLKELCEANNIDSVYIYDENGRTIGTSTDNWYFIISHNEEDQSYPFLQVLDGKLDSYIQESRTDDLGAASQQYIGVAFTYYTTKDENGNTRYISRYQYETASEEEAAKITPHHSLLQIGLDSETSAQLLDSTDVGSVLSTNMLAGGAIVMFDTSEDHLCIYSPVEVSIGKTAKELGVSSNAFSGNDYYGFSKINGVDYFTCFQYRDGYFIATAMPKTEMYKARSIIALITCLICFIVILILSLTVTMTSKEEEDLYATMSGSSNRNALDSAIFNIILPSGKMTSTTKAASRWDNRRIPWSEKSPEQKLMTLLAIIAGIIMIYVIITMIRANNVFDENSIINYILAGGWDKGRNIFAFSFCVLVLITIALGVTLFRIPVRITTALLGARGETIGHLLLSVVKYGGTLFGLFYCLYLLGIDPSRLLASAGILSLIIGLGAQSLIKDIIAGIFIVFEGEFRVGDIVTINGYRGTVMDIGLRTTKILGMDGNIKIYNNSEISGVLNMTQEASVAVCNISIEYGQDIDYVEAVLQRELPLLQADNPKILDGPNYNGISELADSGVVLLITCSCSEADIKGVTRYLNRSLLQIFYRNGINVPFPNVTFSQLTTDGRKTMEDYMKSFKPDDDELFGE
ncbi:MAG: mechanosensitive ion channel [Mogibacterium sp.]|nr:mechanosensitive ion channel [Mogibacterium sp.]